MAKNISEGGYVDFIKYFKITFPDLAKKFGGEIVWSFLDGHTGTIKPSDMSREDFDEFRRIELEWKIENGYMTQYVGAPVFVVVISGLTTISPQQINFIRKLTDNTTTISINEIDGKEYVFDVVGNIDYVNKKIGISSEHE